MSPVTCISGIDTDIGKTVATGLMAKALQEQGHSVITQKMVQTGCTGIAEDIQQHRAIMGIDLLAEDVSGLTCPYVFSKPCSPHLAAELEKTEIDPDVISSATAQLNERFDHVLLEGAGGLLAPLTREMTFLDYVQKQDYPLIIVTSPKLGSINHTLSALELAKWRGITVKGIVYNCYEIDDEEIYRDSRTVFIDYLQKNRFTPLLIQLDSVAQYRILANGKERSVRRFSQFFSENN